MKNQKSTPKHSPLKMDAKALRLVESQKPSEKSKLLQSLRSIKRNPIFFIVDNIYDTYNIGGIFRLADALCVEKLYICGVSETPPHHRIKKASVGTYNVVPWEYKEKTDDAVAELRKEYPIITIAAIEQSDVSIPYQNHTYTLPMALILGNETRGVSPELMSLCDVILEIPMHGVNMSLNVIVATAIIAYHAYNQLDIPS